MSARVLKVRCGSEIKRIHVLADEITFNDLCLMLARLFKAKLSNNIDNMVLKYEDEDGDMISMSDDWDVKQAAAQLKGMKITIYDRQTAPLPDDSTALELAMQKLAVKDALKVELLSLKSGIEKILKVIEVEEQKEKEKEVKKETVASSTAIRTKALTNEDVEEILGKRQAAKPIIATTASIPAQQPQAQPIPVTAQQPIHTQPPPQQPYQYAQPPQSSAPSQQQQQPPQQYYPYPPQYAAANQQQPIQATAGQMPNPMHQQPQQPAQPQQPYNPYQQPPQQQQQQYYQPPRQ